MFKIRERYFIFKDFQQTQALPGSTRVDGGANLFDKGWQLHSALFNKSINGS